jgi:hypothetical protein
MHVPAVLSKDEVTVMNLSDLRFGDGTLSYDRDVSAGVGHQRLEMSVYDMCCEVGQLQDSLKNDPAQMKELPPSIRLPKVSCVMGEIAADGDKNVQDQGTNEDAAGGGGNFPIRKYGAYLVRARLFDVDGSGARKLVRVAEEAFVQVLD